jgi:hypothetical protein
MIKFLEKKLLRHLFNLMPFYRRTGGRVAFISKDEKEIHIKLPFKWNTKGWTGVLYGGHIYSAVDGVHVTLLHRIMGDEYLIWDKSAEIKYLKPARTSLLAKIIIPAGEVETIRKILTKKDTTDREYTIEWKDKNGDVCAIIEKKVHFKRKAFKR